MIRIARAMAWLAVAVSLAVAVKTGDYDRRFAALLAAGTFGVLLASRQSPVPKPRLFIALVLAAASLPLWLEGLQRGELGFGAGDQALGPALFVAICGVGMARGGLGVGAAAALAICSVPAMGYMTHPELAVHNLMGLTSPQSAVLATLGGGLILVVLLTRGAKVPREWIFLPIGGVFTFALVWLLDRAIVLSRLV